MSNWATTFNWITTFSSYSYFCIYDIAYVVAQHRANIMHRSIGIEKLLPNTIAHCSICAQFSRIGGPATPKAEVRIFGLPAPKYRQGFELRCQCVDPTTTNRKSYAEFCESYFADRQSQPPFIDPPNITGCNRLALLTQEMDKIFLLATWERLRYSGNAS